MCVGGVAENKYYPKLGNYPLSILEIHAYIHYHGDIYVVKVLSNNRESWGDMFITSTFRRGHNFSCAR